MLGNELLIHSINSCPGSVFIIISTIVVFMIMFAVTDSIGASLLSCVVFYGIILSSFFNIDERDKACKILETCTESEIAVVSLGEEGTSQIFYDSDFYTNALGKDYVKIINKSVNEPLYFIPKSIQSSELEKMFDTTKTVKFVTLQIDMSVFSEMKEDCLKSIESDLKGFETYRFITEIDGIPVLNEAEDKISYDFFMSGTTTKTEIFIPTEPTPTSTPEPVVVKDVVKDTPFRISVNEVEWLDAWGSTKRIILTTGEVVDIILKDLLMIEDTASFIRYVNGIPT